MMVLQMEKQKEEECAIFGRQSLLGIGLRKEYNNVNCVHWVIVLNFVRLCQLILTTQLGVEAPTVSIQGHVDMVTEKDEGSVHDFMSDPIKLIRDGDWIAADGTTLGADNGLGAVTALVVLDTPKIAKMFCCRQSKLLSQ
eukprot:jgi/Picre1/34342/NNA_001814.t1